MVRKKGREATNKWKKFDERLDSIRDFIEQAAATYGTAEYRRKKRASDFLDAAKIYLNRPVYFQPVGPRLDALRNNQELEPIRRTLGNENWNQLTLFFMGLPDDYRGLGGRARDVRKQQNQVARKCRDLSQLLEARDPEQWHTKSFSPSPLNGAVARFILNSDLVLALDCLRERYPANKAYKKLEHLFSGIYLLDASHFLSHFLRYYADTIEREPFSQYYQLLFQHTGGKLSLKEFTKRAVFESLKQKWPRRLIRPPNKETALVVNAILNLKGKAAVTPNDITQMNKAVRRHYHSE